MCIHKNDKSDSDRIDALIEIIREIKKKRFTGEITLSIACLDGGIRNARRVVSESISFK